MPTQTFNITTGANDQYVEKSGTTYPPTSAVLRNSTSNDVWAYRELVDDGNTAV